MQIQMVTFSAAKDGNAPGEWQDGACGGVAADGSWSFTEQARASEGRLSQRQVADLGAAVAGTRLSGVAATTGCDADRDGPSVRYTWSMNGETRSASTCGPGIDEDDPLVAEVEALVDELGLD